MTFPAGEDFASYLHDPVESPVDISLGAENHNFSQAKNNNGKTKFKMKAEKRTNEQNNTSNGFCEERKSAKKSRLTTSGIRSKFAQLRLQLSFNRYANRKAADDNLASLMPKENEGKKRKKGDGGNLCKSFSSRTGIQSFSFADSKIGIADASDHADLLIYPNMKNFSSENCDAIINTGNRFPDVGQNPEGCTSAVLPYSSIKSRRSAHGSNFTLVSRRWSSVPTFVETDKSVSAEVTDSKLNRLCSTCKPHGFDGDRIDPDVGMVTIWSRISSAIQHGLQCRKLLMKRTTYNIPNAFNWIDLFHASTAYFGGQWRIHIQRAPPPKFRHWRRLRDIRVCHERTFYIWWTPNISSCSNCISVSLLSSSSLLLSLYSSS